jgi:hypothetical protein
MIVGIHQPQFMPWLGYFDKIIKSDIFIFLDDVQYKKNEWQNRNRIKTAKGAQWLTVPVSFHFPEKITEVKVNNETDWRKNHLSSFTTNYSKAGYYNETLKLFADIYEKEWVSLSELNIAVIMRVIEFLGIKTRTIKSSEITSTGASTERLVSLCKELKADTYLSGAGGKDYLEESMFTQAGIKVIFQEYSHPAYYQCFEGFIPNLSILDLLFNCGLESKKALNIPE